jgi:hypothetical protein
MSTIIFQNVVLFHYGCVYCLFAFLIFITALESLSYF